MCIWRGITREEYMLEVEGKSVERLNIASPEIEFAIMISIIPAGVMPKIRDLDQ